MHPDTPTILGFCAEPWVADTGTWYDTRIGGPALWPEAPGAQVPCCPRCERPRYLLLQAFAPHDAHPNRFLLLFACNNIRCSQHADAWVAWRVCQRHSSKSDTHQPTFSPANLTDKPDAVADNPASDDIDWDHTDSDASSNDDDTHLSDSLQLLSLQVDLARAKKRLDVLNPSKRSKNGDDSTSVSPITSLNATISEKGCKPGGDERGRRDLFGEGPTFPAAYIRVEEERRKLSDNVENDDVVNSLLQRYLSEENTRKRGTSVETWVAETDDDSSPSSQAYDAYVDTLSSSPEQILRYSFGSKPLWPTHQLQLPPSTCKCGSELVFEVQLLSSCLYFLRVDSHTPEGQSESGVNYATVAIYTCAKDCEAAPVVHKSETWQVFEQTVIVCPDEW